MSDEPEAFLRMLVFIGVVSILLSVEYFRPARKCSERPWTRWGTNFGLGLANVILPRFLISITAVSFCVFCESRGWGLLNVVEAPSWLSIAVTILAFDCLIYWQHRVFHKIHFLWRFHSIHHMDRHMDLSTGLRFHPVEIVLSLGLKLGAIAILGANVWGYLCFEIILSSFSLFTHSNLDISSTLDGYLRRFVVTPNMHLTHHHQNGGHMNSNYGFSFSFWDRLFGSYTPQVESSSHPQALGVGGFDKTRGIDKMWAMLSMPFRREINKSIRGQD